MIKYHICRRFLSSTSDIMAEDRPELESLLSTLVILFDCVKSSILYHEQGRHRQDLGFSNHSYDTFGTFNCVLLHFGRFLT